MVQVVERDHAMRKLSLLEGVDDLVGGALLVARVGAGGHRRQRLGGDAPRQVEGLQRLPQALQQPVQVVPGIERHPGRVMVLGKLFERAHQERRLAAAGGRHEQHQPLLAQGLQQALLQGRPRHRQPRAQPRALDLGGGDAHVPS